jgi:WD40 repeat protein
MNREDRLPAPAPVEVAVKHLCPLLLLCLAALLPTAAPPADPASAEVARLIRQLGNDDFETREAATTRLNDIGEPALPALHEALASKDAEVRRRAETIVAAIESKLYVELLCLSGHTSPVWSVCISADGKRLLTGSEDKTLRLWDTATGKCLQVFKGHTQHIFGAVLSPDGKQVLSAGDQTVRLWDTATGKEIRQMTGHDGPVVRVAFGPEGRAISGGTDGTVLVWNLQTGKHTAVLSGHTATVRFVAYSDKAKVAATSSYDGSIRLWNLDTGKEVRSLAEHRGPEDLMSLCFSPDGKYLLAPAVDLSLRLVEVATGKEIKRIKTGHAYCAAFSPDGKCIVSGGYFDNVVRVWDIESGKMLYSYQGHTGGVTCVTYFPDGKRIASASADGTARIWRAPQ